MTSFVEGNYTDKYNSSNFIHRWLMTRFLKSFEELLVIVKETSDINTIAEIGCGEGELLKIIHKHFPKAKLYACDLSENEIQKARKNTNDFKVNFSVQNAEKLEQYKKDQFDLVVYCEILEHVFDPNKARKELGRIAKGFAIVSVPNEPLWRILNMMRLKYMTDLGNTPGHVNHWSVSDFKKFIQSDGLSIIRTKTPQPWQMHLIANKL